MQRQASNTPHVYFNQICQRLVEHIEESEIVLGCVAWITHPDVLEALSRKQCCIVIQQENWNVEYRKTWYQQYKTLTPVSIDDLRKVCPQLRNLKNYTNTAIRCVNLPQVNHQQPRMHHKFLIMFKKTGVGIWTGSFNITANACQSLENAMYIDFDPYIKPFVNEFFHMLCLSCELDDVWTPYKYFKLASISAMTDYHRLVPIAIPKEQESLITFDWVEDVPNLPLPIVSNVDEQVVNVSEIPTIPVSHSLDYTQKTLSDHTLNVLTGLATLTSGVRSILFRKSM